MASKSSSRSETLPGYQNLPANFPVLFAEVPVAQGGLGQSLQDAPGRREGWRVEKELDKRFADQRNAPRAGEHRLEACKSLQIKRRYRPHG